MPDANKSTGNMILRVGCIRQWILSGCIDFDTKAGHIDLTVGTGSSCLGIRTGVLTTAMVLGEQPTMMTSITIIITKANNLFFITSS